MPKPRKANVHFHFKAHTPNEVYMDKASKARTWIYEHGNGQIRSPNAEQLSRWKEDSLFDRGIKEYLQNMLRNGGNITPGELATAREIESLAELSRKANNASKLAVNSREVPDIIDYFDKISSINKQRHALIRRTIRESLKKGSVEGQYGTLHSLLSRELKAEGIKVTRDIEPQVFDWYDTVLRKLLYGARPTELEYKKGFIAALSQDLMMEKVRKKTLDKLKQEDIKFFNLVQTTLIDRCTVEQINRLFHLRPEQISGQLLSINGLSPQLAREELEKFLVKHSFHWQRKNHIKKIVKKNRASLIKQGWLARLFSKL